MIFIHVLISSCLAIFFQLRTSNSLQDQHNFPSWRRNFNAISRRSKFWLSCVIFAACTNRQFIIFSKNKDLWHHIIVDLWHHFIVPMYKIIVRIILCTLSITHMLCHAQWPGIKPVPSRFETHNLKLTYEWKLNIVWALYYICLYYWISGTLLDSN